MNRRVCLYLHRLTVGNPTGVHRYAIEMARALTRAAPAGDSVEMWTGRQPGVSAPAGVDARQPRVERRALHLAWTALGYPRFEQVAGRVDIVHALAPVLPIPTRARLVVTIHDLLPMTHPEWYARVPRWANVRALRAAAAGAAAVITPSEVVATDVHRMLGVARDRIATVVEGVDEAFGAETDPTVMTSTCRRHGVEPGSYLVTVGEVGPRKNLPVLFRALERLRAGGGAVAPLLVVGGDGMDADRLRALPRELGVDDVVRFAGRVDDADLHVLVQSARALVHPSSYEGFGLTPLEAMMAGTPVVASAAGSLPEVVGDAGTLVAPTDEEAWARAVQVAVTDDGWSRRMVAAGRRRVQRYTWAAAAEQTWAVYERVLAC